MAASRPIRFTPGDEPWYALNTVLHWPREGLAFRNRGLLHVDPQKCHNLFGTGRADEIGTWQTRLYPRHIVLIVTMQH
jgi:hypothetical protein